MFWNKNESGLCVSTASLFIQIIVQRKLLAILEFSHAGIHQNNKRNQPLRFFYIEVNNDNI